MRQTKNRKSRVVVLLTEDEKTRILPLIMEKMHRKSHSDLFSALLAEKQAEFKIQTGVTP